MRLVPGSRASVFLLRHPQPLAVGLLVLGGLLGMFHPGWVMGESVPYELTQILEEPLEDRVAKLVAERDENGYPYRRGAYSKSFKKVNDSAYQVVFHVDTATNGTMLTERFLYTLKKDPGRDTWSIVTEELQDTYSGMQRRFPGDEEFHRFDSFKIELEGLTVEGARGSLVTDPSQGKVEVMLLAAEGLSYVYDPPMDQVGALYDALKQEERTDFVFDPEHVTVFCDPHSCEGLLESAFTGLRAVSREELGHGLGKTYTEYQQDSHKAYKEDGFRGFRLPFEDERRFVSMAVKKNNVNHRIALLYDTFAPREVTFMASDYGRLYSYYSEATRRSGVSEYELEKRPDLDGRYFDLKSVKGTVELGLEQSERMFGDLTFVMKTRTGMRELPFGIARLSLGRKTQREAKNPRMTINSIQDKLGNELTWVKRGSVSGVLILPEEVPSGTELSLRMQFSNDDCLYKISPSFTYVSREGWLPFVLAEDMIDEFDLTVKVPGKYKTLGIGTKVEESKEKGVSTTRWVTKSPMTFPTVIYGDYVEASPSFDATRSDGTAIPIRIHVDRDGMRDWEIRPKQLRPLANDAANAMNLYREIFGVDYPYGRLDLVNDPTGYLYGQSPASLVYLGSMAFRGEGLVGEIGGGDDTQFVKSLVAHEVGHQWWGGVVNNANSRSYWFIESLAEYSSALYLEARFGEKAYKRQVDAWRRDILEADLRVSVMDAPVLWTGGSGGYRAAVYAQGPYMFHIMRCTFGDEKFFVFLKTLAQEMQGKTIVGRDIQKVAERVFEVNMEDFFDQWLRGVGIPEYKVIYSTRRLEDGSYLVEGKIQQQVLLGKKKQVMPNSYYLAVVRMTIKGKKDKVYAKTIIVDGPETPFQVKVPEQPRKVLINERGEVLAHDIVMVDGSA